MTYIIYCDWMEEFKTPDKWENNSYRVLCEVLENKEHPQFKEIAERYGVLEDGELREDWEDDLRDPTDPIYNYIYPLEIEPTDEKILAVSLKTNCCVLLNTENDTYFLSLTGCGMDMSQDIALAYVLLERWIPTDLLKEVSKQKSLSVGGEDWKFLRNNIIEQLGVLENNTKRRLEEWKETEE